MAKKKTVFMCKSCGYDTAKWMGKCPSCGEFNTFTEETAPSANDKKGSEYRNFGEGSSASPLADIELKAEERLFTGISEADRVFGGGIVKGSLVLLGGEPGAGKSTLALMIADRIAGTGLKTLYVSGEESSSQIKMRAERIGARSKNLLLLIETGVEKIAGAIETEKPGLVVVDSIQTVYKDDVDAAAGSMSQIRESCAHLMYAAKRTGVPVIIIGHVTKDGAIAGPKMLEHMVDAVMYFEAEESFRFKILRAVKNRFGSINEIGVFEMTGTGLCEVKSPSKALLDAAGTGKPGSAV
ncbi:MAG TPA: DNA repair protein RadA, partial [Candidatus Goldiibacteriota bacterium]|nr:DNA repair protein RadA [Candidatus Goldiibacteriota bacterium]